MRKSPLTFGMHLHKKKINPEFVQDLVQVNETATEEEQLDDIFTVEETLSFNQNIAKAIEGANAIDALLAIYTQVSWPILSFKGQDEMIKKVILDYFKKHANINLSSGNFRRMLPNSENIPSEHYFTDKYVLYGVDFLSIQNIHAYFPEHRPQILWIDSSNCLLLFENTTHAYKSISSHLVDQKSRAEENVSNLLAKNWIQFQPYFEFGFIRQLWIRNATLNDIDYYTSISQTQKIHEHHQYMISKGNFKNFLLCNSQVKKMYKEALRLMKKSENLRKKNLKMFEQTLFNPNEPNKQNDRVIKDINSSQEMNLSESNSEFGGNNEENYFEKSNKEDCFKNYFTSNELGRDDDTNGNSLLSESPFLRRIDKSESMPVHYHEQRMPAYNNYDPSLYPHYPYTVSMQTILSNLAKAHPSPSAKAPLKSYSQHSLEFIDAFITFISK